jgi:hypothetical protein
VHAEQKLLESNYDVKQETLERKYADKCQASLCTKRKTWKKKTEEQTKRKRKRSVERSNKKQKLGPCVAGAPDKG